MAEIATGGIIPQQPETTNGVVENKSAVNGATNEVYEQERTTPERDEEPMPTVGTVTPTIVNSKVPVVVFVGPPSSGKSMILVRLAKYLRSQGYTIKTDPTFLNTVQYQRDCENFETCLNTTIALPGSVKYLLVSVFHKGIEVAKMLEAPGEDFYTSVKDPSSKNSRIEAYLATIMTSNNPKSYVTLLDLDSDISFRRDGYHRDSYSVRFLNYFYPAINTRRDKIILLYNKIDLTPFGSINGCHNPSGAREDAKMYYPQLFSTMRVSKLGGFMQVDNFTFLTFCTGMFSKETDEFGNTYKVYTQAADVYPQELWKEITSKW